MSGRAGIKEAWTSHRRVVPVALGLLGIAIAHSPLLTFEPGAGRLEGLEHALFEPTSASPSFVLMCFVLLLYLRWPRLRGFEGREAPIPGSLLLVGGSALCLWARYSGAPGLLIPSLSVLVLASGLLLGGWGAFRTLVFPAIVLLLAMPVPTPIVNHIMYSMQLANASAAGFLLEVVGFEVVVSGDLIFFDDHIFQVIESCSGLRTIMTLLLSACLYTELVWHDRRRTTLLIALSPLLGVVTNLIRILTIIFNPYGSIASVHAAQGVIMLVVAIVILAAIDAVLDRVARTPAEAHFVIESASGRLPGVISIPYAAICSSLAFASLGLSPWNERGADLEQLAPLSEIRAEISGWRLKGFNPDTEFLGSVRFDEFIAHRYESPGEARVDLLVAADWRLDPLLGIGSGKTRIPGPGGVELPVDRDLGTPGDGIEALLVRLPGETQLVYHWKVGLASTWTETLRAVLALDRSPFRRPGRAVFVRLSTPVERSDRGLDEAIGRLGRFIAALRADFISTGVWPDENS